MAAGAGRPLINFLSRSAGFPCVPAPDFRATRDATYSSIDRPPRVQRVRKGEARSAQTGELVKAFGVSVRAENTEGKRHDEPLARSATYAAGQRRRFP